MNFRTIKFFPLLTFVFCIFGDNVASASVTLNFGAAQLFSDSGTTILPVGSLLQLVASTTDNVFTAPTSSSFTGGSGDDQVVASFNSNNVFGAGSFNGLVV